MSNNQEVPPSAIELQSAFPIIVFGAVAVSVVMSLVFLFSRGSAFDHIGDGGLTGESDPYGSPPPLSGESLGSRAEQEIEIRQMLAARNVRLAGRGEPQVDIDAEVAKLLAPAAQSSDSDPGLTAEVRQLVVARNERRARRGQEPLDVEQEVQRTLTELQP